MKHLSSEVYAKESLIGYRDLIKKFRYDPETGELWSLRHKKVIQTKIFSGRSDVSEYRYRTCRISINKVSTRFRQHRIAWCLMTGSWPQGEIDHINRNTLDNRWVNLRDVDRSTNCLNTRRRGDLSCEVRYWVPKNGNGPSNTGVCGVSRGHNHGYVQFQVYYGRDKSTSRSNFFEAVCVRKSWELSGEDSRGGVA